jgi:hypothetical protein
MANSSVQLFQTLEWAKRFVFRRPLALGNFNEPAITSANLILQTILGAPFAWRWNRAVLTFITNPGQQDYIFFNWTPSFLVTVGFVLVDSNGFSQQITTSGQTATIMPAFNTNVGGITSDGTATWTNKGSAGLSNFNQTAQFGWIENCSVRDTNPSTLIPEWKPIESKLDLSLDSTQTRPRFIAAEFDNGINTVTFRLMPAPDKAYPVSVTIQQKPPVITGLNGTWTPIPDEYSRLYNWGFLSLMYQYTDDARFQYANQKFIANLLSTSDGLTETERNIVLNNWMAVTGQPTVLANNIQDGFKGRGAF